LAILDFRFGIWDLGFSSRDLSGTLGANQKSPIGNRQSKIKNQKYTGGSPWQKRF
jgi:hypothetical protein